MRQFQTELQGEHKHGHADIPLIAKLEKPEAIAQLNAILDVADGIMVARGDLGVEMSPEKVPQIQKYVIARCTTQSGSRHHSHTDARVDGDEIPVQLGQR